MADQSPEQDPDRDPEAELREMLQQFLGGQIDPQQLGAAAGICGSSVSPSSM